MRYKGLKSRKKSLNKIRIRKKRLFFLLTFILLIVVIFTGIRLLGSYQSLQNRSSWAAALRKAPQDQGTNYLLFGFYGEGKDAVLEELFFLNFSAPSSSPQIFFIPGEMLLHRLSGEGKKGENDLNESDGGLMSFYIPSHFYNEGGAKYLIEQISLFLGTPVHHYLEINYEGVSKVVDSRGPIPYGNYVLAGKDYLDYFLNLEKGGDPLERGLRRVRMLKDLVEFLGDAKGIFATPRLLKKASPYVQTDLSWKELQKFYGAVGSFFEPEQLVLTLPGSWQEFNGDDLYFAPDVALVGEMMTNLGREFVLPRQLVTVEVLNGGGVAGTASQVAEMLRQGGYQVVTIDNAEHFGYQQTQVISRIDEIDAVREIAVMIPGAELLKEPLPDYPVMVTVIVGKNYVL